MNLEQLRKLAKERLGEQRRADPEAKLSGAQLAIAREQGFPSWPRMKAYADRLAAHPDGVQFAYQADLGYYEERAYGCGRPPRTARRAGSRRSSAPALPSPRAVPDWSSPEPMAFRAGRRCVATSAGWRAAASRSPAPTAPSRRTIQPACSRCWSGGPRLLDRRARTATTCSAWPPAHATSAR